MLEETGLCVAKQDMRFLTATNDIFSTDKKHYITLFMACQVPDDARPDVSPPAEPHCLMSPRNGTLWPKAERLTASPPLRYQQVCEPEKCERWEWHSWQDLKTLANEPDNHLFLPLQNLIKQCPDLDLTCKA